LARMFINACMPVIITDDDHQLIISTIIPVPHR